jgi:hypoxanthine phosphoribosyltransferase
VIADSTGVVEPLISTGELRTRVGQLAGEVRATFDGNDIPILISILKGSTLFLADLARAMDITLEVDFMSISSYAGSQGGSGVVRIVKDLDTDISDRDVLIVEDIVDTGFTLTYLRRTLGQRGPRTLQTVTLLDKAARRIVPVPLEHKGFEIPDVFVLGYGMDFQGRYRNVPEILAVKDLARLANDPLMLSDGLYGEVG